MYMYKIRKQKVELRRRPRPRSWMLYETQQGSKCVCVCVGRNNISFLKMTTEKVVSLVSLVLGTQLYTIHKIYM